jgi:hypothetical protein
MVRAGYGRSDSQISSLPLVSFFAHFYPRRFCYRTIREDLDPELGRIADGIGSLGDESATSKHPDPISLRPETGTGVISFEFD